jgi:tRNA(fMet)-specific endonuclease VapC
VVKRIQVGNAADIYLCSVVLGELIFGAFHSGPAHQAANLAQIATLRQQFASLPFDDTAAEQYGAVREDLLRKGLSIGPNDLMIAAIALANGLTLVTHNTAEFSRVTGLALEDWQVP